MLEPTPSLFVVDPDPINDSVHPPTRTPIDTINTPVAPLGVTVARSPRTLPTFSPTTSPFLPFGGPAPRFFLTPPLCHPFSFWLPRVIKGLAVPGSLLSC
jgi:hypothetical protein